jgi:hypothetical protein
MEKARATKHKKETKQKANIDLRAINLSAL